jgi:hypothetical protein
MRRGRAFYLDALVRRAAALSGLSAENMTRGPNWLFMDLGRRIERASHLAWLVRQTVYAADVQETDAYAASLLEIADSAMTYRSRYLNVFQIVPFVDLLLLDDANPRSAAFQLAAIESHLRELPRITLAQRSDCARQHRLGNARRRRQCPSRRGWRCARRARPALGELTDTIISQRSGMLSDAIADAYFQHASRRRTGAARRGATCDGISGPPSHHLSLSAGCFLFLPSGAFAPARNPQPACLQQQRHAGSGARQPRATGPDYFGNDANGSPWTSRTICWKCWRKAGCG